MNSTPIHIDRSVSPTNAAAVKIFHSATARPYSAPAAAPEASTVRSLPAGSHQPAAVPPWFAT